jgi:hypothetical protein
MAILERVSDEHGSVVLGWAHAGVFYAKFEGSISGAVAQRFARRFAALIGDTIRVRYFGDSSGVTSYEPQALGAISSVMLSKRQRFDSIVVRPWQGGVMGAPANAFADAFGCLEFVMSALEFERRFRAALPGGDIHPFTIQSEVPFSAPACSDAARPPAPGVAERGHQSVTYSYVFDLSEFEAGRFVATRSEHLGERPGQGWVCVARDDQQALELARQAARLEWAQPLSRRPEDFTVEFRTTRLSIERPFERRQ